MIVAVVGSKVRGAEGGDPALERVGADDVLHRQIFPELDFYRLNPIFLVRSGAEIEQFFDSLEWAVLLIIQTMRTFTDTMGSSIFGIPKSVLCAFIANTASAALIFVPSIVKLTFCAAITILQD